MRALSLVGLLSLSTACYTYHAVPLENAPVGHTVRARISAAEAERVSGILGREQRLLEGQLIDRPDGGLLIAIPSTLAVQGSSSVATFQRISVPRESLLEVETRRLDKRRTAGAIAFGVTAVTLVAVNAFANSNSSGRGGKGSGNQMRVPFRLPFAVGH
jgi:hypothetical protein